MAKKEYSGPAEEIFDELVILYAKLKPPWDEIISKCKQGLEMDPRFFPAYFYLGMYEMEQKNYDGMEEHFLQALELADKPHNPITWDNILYALEDTLVDYERLARYLEKFYEKQPDFFVLRNLTRVLWKMLNRRKDALVLLDRHIMYNPEDKRAEKLRNKVLKAGNKTYVRFNK